MPTKRRRLYGAILRSSDPNDIAGPAGVGLGRYIAPGQLAYRIDFENVGVGTEHIPAGRAAGTAPAATVTITETLDADLDPATLALGVMEIGVDGGAYPKMTFVPPPNVQAYSETRRVTVPVYGTAEHVAIDVRVTASLAPDTGVVSWAFEAIDPMTGLTPADPLIGLLPPEPVTPEGLGHGSVEYSVAARAGLATGTQIDAQARVVFDQEAPLDTPTWRNTVDVDPPVPTGLVDGRGAGPSVAVSWDSTDLGAGVDVFDVFVGDGVAPLRPWKVASTARNGMYVGEVGHTYRFAVRAADLVGNTDGILHAAVVDAPATTDPSAPPAAAPPPPPPAPPEVVPVTDLGPRLANLSYQGGRRPYPSGIVRFLVDLQASQGANRQVRVLKRTAAKTRRRPERFVQLGALTLDAYGDGRFSFRTPKPAQGDIYVVVDAVTGAELYRAKIFSKR